MPIDGESEDKNPSKSTEATNEPPKECLRIKIIAHSGDGHQAPPEGLNKGPGIAGVTPNMFPFIPTVGRFPVSAIKTLNIRNILLCKVDQTGVGEDAHSDQHKQQAKLLVSLLKGVKQ